MEPMYIFKETLIKCFPGGPGLSFGSFFGMTGMLIKGRVMMHYADLAYSVNYIV